MSNDPFNVNSYVAFDGTSIRDLIISKLNQSQIFTDQNYQGSNLSALIDIIGYSFSTLLFYLNKTSSESMFTEAQLYENMNRIVKLLNYNPVGRLGQNVPFTIKASEYITAGNYTIPRYSNITVGGTTYSFNQDINFTKYSDLSETVEDIANTYLIYQGSFQEYPLYTALGISNEIIYLSLPSDIHIDHFNIFVYVKPFDSERWEDWTRASELFLYNSTDSVYEVRFNPNKNYEIKFGDDVNGRKLRTGDQVQIFYLNINKNATGIGPNSLNNTPIVAYNSKIYNQIIPDITINQRFLTTQELSQVLINNDYPSTVYSGEEGIDSIRSNAPQAFRSQYRLVTTTDYESYIRSNYSNFLSDLKLVNNDDYLKNHIKYLYNIGLNEPQKENRILINQINFANNCNFNNLYLYMVPSSELQEYLSPPQKEMILNGLQSNKTLTSQIVPMDPVYMYLDFYVPNPDITPNPNDLINSQLLITKNRNTRRADSAILSDVLKVFSNNFNRTANSLGQSIDLYQLSTSILNIEGVSRIQTYRKDTDTYVEGISVLLWNSTYPENDSEVYSQNINLDYFKYPIFNNIKNLASRITVKEITGAIKAADF
jgi:hypothetical protein